MGINYQKFIEANFSIKNKGGRVVPYLFNKPQDLYFLGLVQYYGQELQGIRDIILKGRKMGFSSVILAMFAADFLLEDFPIASVCIANTKDETKKLLARARFFIESALEKKGQKLDDICDTSNTNEIINRLNGASFVIGTAGSKTALRVDSVQNLHFSEAAHFQDSDVITARETIEGALQMVDQGIGKVFIESTANGYGNYYQKLETKARKSPDAATFRSVFFAAHQLYTPEWLAQKEREFTTKEMYWQEYPDTPEHAYMSSGSKFFDSLGIEYLQSLQRAPIESGRISSQGEMLAV